MEYRKQLEAQNSSYKLDEKSLKYYNQLKQEEREKERLRKEREEFELAKLRIKKAQLTTNIPSNHPVKPMIHKITKKKPQVKAILLTGPIDPSETVDKTTNSTIHPGETSKLHEKDSQSDPSSIKSTKTSQLALLGDYSSDSE